MSLLQDLFITILNMSITASYAAIGVILVRLLLKKAPKVFSYILWIPVLFRLVCPFSFDSAFSFFNLINLNAKQGSGAYEFVPQNIGLMHTPAIQSNIGGLDGGVNASLPAAVPAASVNPMEIWMTVFSLIWIFGVIALFIYSIISYVKIKRKLRTATRVEGNVFETDAIGTAFVCGFIRPKIYVPANIGDANLSYILEHERTHIRRKDYLIKPLAFLALILHWFNPLMLLCFALMSRDMEMSCDESVMHRLGDSAKGGYSGSLLALSIKRKGFLAVNPLAFGESHVKARIKNVLNFKKPAFWVIMIAVVAVCSAVVAFTANPSKEGTISAEDKRKLAAVVTEYYLKADPANKGTLRIYNIKKYGSGYLVLTEKYRGEGESFSVLFLVNHDFNIVAKAPGDIPKSPCFSANVVKDQGKSIVYGNFKNKKWNPQTDLVVDVQIDFIKITFEDGTYIREQVSTDKGYIVVVDTLSNIRNIEVYNSKGELQSDLINESACSEYDFIDVIDEKSSDRIASLIDENLAAIMSSPKISSNSQDYINAHQAEYNAILALETQALPYLIDILESGDKGLRGNIAATLCEDIVKKLLDENKDVDPETEKIIKEALMAVDKWNATNGNKSQDVVMPEFTKEEVAAARAVVEEYYRAVAAKDAEAILATMYPREGRTLERVKSGNVQLFGTEKRTLLSIDYDSQDSVRKSYKPGGKYVEPENIIVFRVSFNIDYPEKVTGPWNEGVYENWNMILIRDDKNSPWLIYDQGY